MLVDARAIDSPSVVYADICIVGAGAAGISIAHSFAGTPFRVVVLESGSFDYDDRVQELQRGRVTGQSYYPLKSTRLRQIGGTTNHWGGMCSVFEPLAFSRRDWIDHSGWPIQRDELVPYYKKAAGLFGLEADGFGLDSESRSGPAEGLLPLDRRVFFNKLWKLSPSTHLRFGEKWGPALVGAANVHLYKYATAVNLRTSDDLSRVVEVDVRNHEGKSFSVRAVHVVLASCAIQNARLLLASNRQNPRGLGNGHDLVGRYFMENVEVHGAELWLKESSSLRLYTWGSGVPQARTELGLTEQTQREMKIANGMLSFVPLEVDKNIAPFIELWNSDDPRENQANVGKAYRDAREGRLERAIRRGRYKSFSAVLRLEQVPNSRSRVTLDSEKDELGVPRPVLHWDLTTLERKSLRSIYKLFGRHVGIARIGRVRLSAEIADERSESMPESTSGGWHHMGTTRMAVDPKEGVVDANCRVHGIENLYVAGSSCFPNGAAVNPTLTLVALSLRLADHVRTRLKGATATHKGAV